MRVAVRLSLLSLILLAAGCRPPPPRDLRLEVRRLRRELDEAQQRLAAQKAAIEALHRQLQIARGLSDQDLQRIYYPDQIVLERLTGGEDFDHKPGDDGVVVFVRPVDREGDPIKVAGRLRVEVYDLTAPSGQKLIGTCEFGPDELAKMWYGKLWTYHYTVRCPWRRPPRTNEVTVRVTFIDYLTKRVLTAQIVCTVQPQRPRARTSVHGRAREVTSRASPGEEPLRRSRS